MDRSIKLSRRKRWPALLAAALLAVPAALAALPGVAGAADEPEPEILPHMEAINRNYKLLRRATRRPDYLREPRYVDMVVEMQDAALKAMHVESIPMAEKLADEQQKRQMMIGFKKVQAKLITALLDLEIALLENRTEDAAAIITLLAEIKQEGHEAYVEE